MSIKQEEFDLYDDLYSTSSGAGGVDPYADDDDDYYNSTSANTAHRGATYPDTKDSSGYDAPQRGGDDRARSTDRDVKQEDDQYSGGISGDQGQSSHGGYDQQRSQQQQHSAHDSYQQQHGQGYPRQQPSSYNSQNDQGGPYGQQGYGQRPQQNQLQMQQQQQLSSQPTAREHG
ncbi:hypothetical protein BGZ94_008158 [Podila epigama]|nr:hypothetical protein BGZ94_008158 [Podila epigama]